MTVSEDVDARSALVDGVAIAGTRLVPLDVHADERGSFAEIWAAHWDSGITPEQWSLVHSEAGVLRGMHLHARHDEYVLVVTGTMSLGLYDARQDSPTSGQWGLYLLDGADPHYLSWPPGLVHGWLSHTDTIHVQAVSEAYVTYGLDDNHGCRWDDPDLGIPWPFTPSTVSDRAEDFPSLRELLATVRV